MAVIKHVLLLTILFIYTFVRPVTSECCRKVCGGRCADSYADSVYCGVGNCNFFGCNCEGGCRKGNCHRQRFKCGKLKWLQCDKCVGCEGSRTRRSAPAAASPFESKTPAEIFAKLDRNHDLIIEREEFDEFSRAMNLGNEAMIDLRWNATDLNGDGIVTINEIDPWVYTEYGYLRTI